MAFDLSKLNFFSKLDAKARILVLIGGLFGMILLVYVGTKMLSGSSKTVGPSKVASAPSGLQTVPGGQQTPEFSRAVEQANSQRAQQASMTGESAIPTLVNTSQPGGATSCIICTDQVANIQNNLDDWVRQGKMTPDTAKAIASLAAKKVPIAEFAAQLDKLVKDGKITAAQARELLDTYSSQYAGSKLNDSAKIMDDMIKSGELPLAVANELLELQKKKVSAADYAAKLKALVDEGKITPQAAQKLLAQYTQQQIQDNVAQRVAALHEMAAKGEITPEVESQLVDLERRGVSVDAYAAALDQLVAQGKITPAVAKKILEGYKAHKAAVGPSSLADGLAKEAEAAVLGNINDLAKSGKISQEVADGLGDLIKKDASEQDFTAALNKLVQEGKMPPDVAKQLLDNYKTVKKYRELAASLNMLQGNNASLKDFANALKLGVQQGLITPDQATEMMRQYQAITSKAPTVATQVGTTTSAGAEFAKLQQRLQKNAATQASDSTVSEFENIEGDQVSESAADQAEKIQSLMQAMSNQAGQLINSWQPPTMAQKVGTPDKKGGDGEKGAAGSGEGAGGAAGSAGTAVVTPALIKAGTIQFAVLDTEANSDYPDSPIMATIVDGKLKGAKLLGKLRTTKGVAGQLDRISLQFTLMNSDAWPNSKAITAYAIDPDTARTVLASSVNYHYLQRFGAMMATSFLQGYSTAITTSSSTSTTGIFGTSTTNPQLSPSNKLMVGLGQVGQTLGKATQNYANLPPTVRVDSGVGLGILFMSDVS